jgi:ParB family chromosome partitioning protein
VQSGALTAGHARALIGAKNAEALADVIIKRGLSVRAAEKLVQKSAEGKLKAPKGRAFVQKDVDILALEEKLTATLGLRVAIDGGASGKITVEYKTLEQLDDVIARLSHLPAR